MDMKEIKELVALMEESSLSELSLKTKTYEVKLKKDKKESIELSGNETQKLETKEVSKDKKELLYFKSPMVGTFYSSATQESDPYVKEGDIIKKGQPLCVIEAMKMMNEIECEKDMKILEILVGEEQKVEYDQPLFRIQSME